MSLRSLDQFTQARFGGQYFTFGALDLGQGAFERGDARGVGVVVWSDGSR